MQTTRRPTLDALTGLRFFAALHVVFHHYLFMIPGIRATAPDWFHRLIASAPGSLVIFFVLSGFILTYNYMRPEDGLQVSKRQFFAARFARVYPVYLLAFLVYLPIAVTRYRSGTGLTVVDVGPGATFWVSGVLTLLLVQSWSVVFGAWNGPCWSVSAEAFFYSIFPAAAPRIMSLPFRRMLWLGALAWLLSLIGPAFYLIAVLGHRSKQTTVLWEVVLAFHPLFRVVPFLFGIAIGTLFLRRRRQAKASDGVFAILAVAVTGIVWITAPTEAERLVENLLTPVFALLVYSLAFGRGTLYRFLSHPTAVLLGEASYSLYLLHNPLWNYMARLPNMYVYFSTGHFPVGYSKPGIQTEWNYDMSGWVFCIYLVVLVGISLLSLRYVERPARNMLRRYFAQSRPESRPRLGLLNLDPGTPSE